MRIYLNPLDVQSVQMAFRELQEYLQTFSKKLDELMRRLAEIAMQTAQMSYSIGGIDGNNDVTVTIEPIENGYVVRADGKDVYFLEFGTGLAAGDGYDTSVIEPPVDISPASWSSTYGTGEFARYGAWHHDGVKYTMTVPTMGMYHAVKEVEAQIQRVANEVFES